MLPVLSQSWQGWEAGLCFMSSDACNYDKGWNVLFSAKPRQAEGHRELGCQELQWLWKPFPLFISRDPEARSPWLCAYVLSLPTSSVHQSCPLPSRRVLYRDFASAQCFPLRWGIPNQGSRAPLLWARLSIVSALSCESSNQSAELCSWQSWAESVPLSPTSIYFGPVSSSSTGVPWRHLAAFPTLECVPQGPGSSKVRQTPVPMERELQGWIKKNSL